MSGNLIEERLLRYAAPELYKEMVEAFSTYKIHPYDVQARVQKKETGIEVTIWYSTNFSQSTTAHFSFTQAIQPDAEVTSFFKDVAEKCKASLISDYYKMIKP